MAADQPTLPATLAGYRLDQLVGRGGMGSVYRATRLADGSAVAVKLITAERARNESFRTRFEREGRLASTLEHPHLVRVLETGTLGEVPFMAMQLIDGIDLEGVIAAHGPLHPRTAAGLVAQIASGLDAAHSMGLVHRDVKPANVLLERRVGVAHAYVTDFGLSKHVDSTSGITATGQWIGTVDYAAPEQLRAERTDAQTDVYALGCLLYELITGSVPYPRSRDVDKLLAHLSGPAPRVSETVPEAPAALDSVVCRAMAQVPEQRFGSAGELAAAATAAVAESGPEPEEPIGFPADRVVDTDAPTAA